MSKYEVGDKIILTVTGTDERGHYPNYVLNDNFYLWEQSIDNYAEPLYTYTEPLERKNKNKQKQIEKMVDKLHRQVAEITRLLAKNKELKEQVEKANRTSISRGRLAGQNEAWELARKCMLMSSIDREAIFGSGFNAMYGVLMYHKYHEAAAKVAEWEKAKEEVKVGDVLESKNGNGEKIAVMCAWMSTDGLHFEGIGSNGAITIDALAKYYTKTGRHIDINGILRQIGGEEE